MMVGYPGAGKTTAALAIRELIGAEHIWADLERKRMFKHPTYSQIESQQLYDYLNQRVEQLLAQGKSVIFDTNFNFYKDRQRMRDIAASNGGDCWLLWVQADPDLSFQRASQNIEKQPTRVLGGIQANDFQRIAGRLQPPCPEEQPLILDGTKITKEYLAERLGLKDRLELKT